MHIMHINNNNNPDTSSQSAEAYPSNVKAGLTNLTNPTDPTNLTNLANPDSHIPTPVGDNKNPGSSPRSRIIPSETKAKIAVMRAENFSCQFIGNVLGLPASTVKSICQRNNYKPKENLPRKTKAEKRTARFCLYCMKPLPDSMRSHAKFCSSACRLRYFKARKKQYNGESVNSQLNAKEAKETKDTSISGLLPDIQANPSDSQLTSSNRQIYTQTLDSFTLLSDRYDDDTKIVRHGACTNNGRANNHDHTKQEESL